MSKINIALLYGGKSGEHDVSIMSATSVFNHLDNERYNPTLIGIARDGIWYLQKNPDVSQALQIVENDTYRVSVVPGVGFYVNGKQLAIDIVFPVLHGTNGEDGTIQGTLEIAGLAYVGASVLGSAVGINKIISKKLWTNSGLPVVPFMEISAHQYQNTAFSVPAFAAECEKNFGFPCFVKPASAGSSVGVSRAADIETLTLAIEKALMYDTTAMVEPAIEGREVECSVIGNHAITSFTPGEIVPSHEFYSYEAKYIDPEGALLRIPADIDEATQRQIKEIAEKAYRSAKIEGMARVDFFVEKKTGEILLNEINTIPGFTNISMFSRMCQETGLPYHALLDELISLGQKRFEERADLSFEV